MSLSNTSVQFNAPNVTVTAGTVSTLGNGTGIGAKRFTITNRSAQEVFIRRQNASEAAPSNATVLAEWTYVIPARTTWDDECGDGLAYYAAVASGSSNIGVQELA